MQQEGFKASLWAATAAAAPATPPLDSEERTDVVVIGGGYTGLSAALHLAENGAAVRVLDSEEPGWGASGRSGGQVIPGLKHDPDELMTLFGSDLGERMVDFAGKVGDLVFGLVDRHAIDCHPVRHGWIQPAHNRAGLALVRRRCESWARRGAPVELLDGQRAATLLGTEAYLGGWLDRRGGALQPLSYVRGLALAAQKAGARVHGRSPVTGLARHGQMWRATTPRGAVTAAMVVIATNAYTGELWPKLDRSIIPVHSFMVATRPLSDNVRRTILPEGQVSSDTRRLLLYFRFDHTGRLLMGGRGTLSEPASADDAAFAALKRTIQRMFPQVGEVEYDHHWFGKVAITRDHLPHLHEPAPGVVAGLGFNGRGIGMGTAMGAVLARRARGEDRRTLPLPVTPIVAIPLHRLRRLTVGAMAAYYRLRDRIG